MARKVMGPTGSRRRRWLFLCTGIAAIAIAVLFIPSAFAVHDTGAFELDGNATSQTSDDWDRACYQVAVNGGASAAQATAQCTASQGLGTASTGAAWVNDGALNATIFTGGGSKDPSDINNWAWKTDTGGLPDKDNLLHAYAAEYSLPGTNNAGICPNGTDLPPPIGNNAFDSTVNCRVLFFGSDRYDNSGDAQQGFWFFQNKVGTNTGGAFSGVHKNGDVLVISDFSNGGTTSTITIYKWDSTCKKAASNTPTAGQCGDANLRLLSTSTDALCGGGLAQNDSACGIVNSGTITMPWSFTDKSGTAGNGALNGEFFEAGINLSTLGLAGECFSSVASETRSSTSTTATLKDFVLGGFEKCTPALTTQVKNGSGTNTNGTIQPGTAVHDTAKVTVTGAQSPADATGTVDFFLCGPNALQAPDCSTGGTQIGGDVTLTDTSSPANANDGISGGSSADVNGAGHELANGFYCFRAEAHTTNYDSPTAYTDSTNECFQVLKLNTTIVTSPQSPSGTDNAGPFNLKDTPTIYDHAVVTGAAGGGFPEGTVSFFICTPSQVVGGVCASGAGTQVGSNVTLTHVSGETIKSEATSSGFSITTSSALGTYCFRAVYNSTSAVYNGVDDANTTTECFTVQNASSSTSAQTWLPNDQIFIKSDAGSIPGTLTVQLVKGACDPTAQGATLIYTDANAVSFTATASGSGAEYDTSNTTHAVTTAGPDDYYWRAVFTPTSSFATGVTKCEKSTLTINNSP
jgi:hypothetical protein